MKHTPDINVLIAAARNDHTHHALALDWLESTLTAAHSSECSIVIPMVAIAGFIRLISNKQLFVNPASAAQAVAFIDQLLLVRNVEIAEAHQGWPSFRALVLDKAATGNAVPDAWLASHVLATNAVLTTFDKDFTQLLSKANLNLLKPT